MPALAPPYYSEYSLGDYAFGKDVEVGTSTIDPLTIDIIPMLQYDKDQYLATQVRLYLVDASGNRVVFKSYVGTVITPTIETGNYPNVPATRGATGTVSIINTESSAKPQKFLYTPDSPAPVTDSFYYMFQIVSTDGATVLLSSSMGKVTINICQD